MMRKILSIILIIIFTFSFAACKKNPNNTSSIPDNTTSGFINLDLVPEDENNTSNIEQGENASNTSENASNTDGLNSQINNNSLSSNTSDSNTTSSNTDVDTNASPTKKPSNNTASNTISNNNTNNNANNQNKNENSDNTSSLPADITDGNNNTTNDTDKNNETNNDTNSVVNDNKNDNINGNTDKNNTTNNDKNNTNGNNGASNDKNNTNNNNVTSTDKNNTTVSKPSNNENNNVDNKNDKNNNIDNTDKNNTSSNSNSKPSLEDNTDKNNQTNNNENNPNPPQNNPNNDNNAENDKGSYKDINCRNVTDWRTVELVSNNNSLYFSISLPNDWVIDNNGIIKLNNLQIGELSTKTESHLNIYEEIKSDNTISGTTASSSIREYKNDKELSYKRVIRISKLGIDGNLANLYISAEYSQLDNNATSKILNSISDKNGYRPAPLLDKSSSKNVLFLGNNNIENSKIDNFLSSMLFAGNKLARTVYKQPVGGNEVVNFMTPTIINDISDGNYSIVFINGFYTLENTVEPIKTFIDACKKSNTMLVLLPAYDDSDNIVETILNTYSEVFCINWKNELQNLDAINDSLHSSDFYSETNKLSTELSGYVGAHLIYRTIFGETPPTITDNLPSNYDKIKNLLPKAESKKDIFFIQ